MPQKDKQAISALLACTFLFGWYAILVKLLGFDIPLFFAAWTRGLISVPIIWLIFLASKDKWVRLQRADWIWLSIRAVVGWGLSYSLNYWALFHLPVGTAYFVLYAGSTIASYAISKILLGEPITRIRLLSLLLALVGLILVYWGSITLSSPGWIGVAFLGGLAFAIWNTLAKKVRPVIGTTQVNFIDYVIGTLSVFVVSLLFQEQWVMPALTAPWMYSLGLGIIYIITGQLMVYGFRNLNTQIASLIMLTEIIFALLLSALFFHDIIAPLTWVGGVCIVAAIVIPELYSNGQHKTTA